MERARTAPTVDMMPLSSSSGSTIRTVPAASLVLVRDTSHRRSVSPRTVRIRVPAAKRTLRETVPQNVVSESPRWKYSQRGTNEALRDRERP
eukprot:802263-Prorocentrum_minimum.AAC.1